MANHGPAHQDRELSGARLIGEALSARPKAGHYTVRYKAGHYTVRYKAGHYTVRYKADLGTAHGWSLHGPVPALARLWLAFAFPACVFTGARAQQPSQ